MNGGWIILCCLVGAAIALSPPYDCGIGQRSAMPDLEDSGGQSEEQGGPEGDPGVPDIFDDPRLFGGFGPVEDHMNQAFGDKTFGPMNY